MAPEPVPTSTMRGFASRSNALQHGFHQVLGFGTRDQDIGRDLEEQAKKLLHAGDVLHWLRSQAALEQALELI